MASAVAAAGSSWHPGARNRIWICWPQDLSGVQGMSECALSFLPSPLTFPLLLISSICSPSLGACVQARWPLRRGSPKLARMLRAAGKELACQEGHMQINTVASAWKEAV